MIILITAQNIMSHEFIGLDVHITHSTNPQVIGLNGRVIDETKSMFTIDTKDGHKSIPKSGNDWKFRISDGDEDIPVNGSKIIKRPYDRIVGGIKTQ